MTAHKMLGIPIVQEYSLSRTVPPACDSSDTQKGIIKKADIVFCDEITMTPLPFCESVERLVASLKKSNETFGGCTLVFSRDFRQCSPVVICASSLHVLYERCFLNTNFVSKVLFLKLKENMRIRSSATSDADRQLREERAKLLLDLGSGFNLPSDSKGFENMKNICVKNFQYLNGVAEANKRRLLGLIYPDRVFQDASVLLDPSSGDYDQCLD